MCCATSGQGYSVEHKHRRNVIPLLQPGRETPDSTNDCFNRFCLGSIIALRQQTAWRYPGRDCRPQPLSHTQFQSQLATWLIWTRSGRIRALPRPVVAKTPPQPRCRLWIYESMLICHILLFNEHGTPLSNGAPNWLTCDASSALVIWTPISIPYRPAPSPRFGLVPGQHGTHLFLDCVTLCVMMLSSVPAAEL